MTAPEFAALLDARRVARGRWQARCPAHEDRSPSLSIGEAADGRVLVHCFAGCTLAAVLEAAGLRMADLFAGPPPSPKQTRDAARERLRRETEAKTMRLERIRLTDHYRRLWRVNDALGAKLARAADDAPGVNVLARLFHQSVEELRQVEDQLVEVEQCR
jgi:hypothetical protein